MVLLWCCCGAVVGVLQSGSKLKAKTAADTYSFFFDMFCLSGTYMLYVQNFDGHSFSMVTTLSQGALSFFKGPFLVFFKGYHSLFKGPCPFPKDSFLFQGPEPSRKLHVKEDQQAVAQLWLCHYLLAFVDMQLPRLSMPFPRLWRCLGKGTHTAWLGQGKTGFMLHVLFFCLMSGEVQIE